MTPQLSSRHSTPPRDSYAPADDAGDTNVDDAGTSAAPPGGCFSVTLRGSRHHGHHQRQSCPSAKKQRLNDIRAARLAGCKTPGRRERSPCRQQRGQWRRAFLCACNFLPLSLRAKLSRAFQQATSKHTALARALNAANANIQQLTAQLEAATASAAQATRARDTAQQQLTASAETVQQLRAELAAANTAAAEVVREHDAAQQQLADSVKNVQQLTAHVEAAATAAADATRERDAAQQQLAVAAEAHKQQSADAER